MRYFASFDGGGTKLAGVLFDEDLRPVRSCRTGGVNANFLSEEQVKRNSGDCVRQLLESFEGVLEGAYVSMTAPAELVAGPLRARYPEIKVAVYGEGRMGLLAGLCENYGFTALSGTGSDVFYEGPHEKKTVGGWGLLLGDEGSGGWIGQRGLIAAIHASDGRGARTSLFDAACECFGFLPEKFHAELIREIYRAASPRERLAAFTPFVGREADAGDAEARRVIEEAAHQMALQMNTLMDNVCGGDPGASALPSTVCGGAWKCSPEFFKIYAREVAARHPALTPAWPLFDAVAGGAAAAGLGMGFTPDEVRRRMLASFTQFRYPDIQ